MDIATPFYNGNTAIVNPNGYTIFQDFDYTSGFKVGLGVNLNVDDWTLDLEYTYLRQKTFTSSGTLPLLSGGQTGSFEFERWFSEKAFGSFGFASCSNFNSSWKLDLDWLDLTFKRPYYQGRRLVITPSAGLRASWIRQNLKITGFNTQIIGLASNNITDISSNRSNSWAIGPRGLLDAHWLVGAGFRFQGNFGASLLFTQFTKISHKETGGLVTNSTIPGPYKYKLTNYNCLRPMMEANVSIGWGSYFSDNGYHLVLLDKGF